MPEIFNPQPPFPSRKAHLALRQQVVDYLLQHRPAFGAPFVAEAQLARDCGLTRPTVRRALDELCVQGWLERQPGKGIFIGPRTALPGSPSLPTDHMRVVRLGVIVSMFRGGQMDWFHSQLLRGLDDAAGEHALSIELLGHKANDPQALCKRLMQDRHDLIVSTTHSWPELMVLAEARRQGIACLDAGSRSTEWHIPNIFEDSPQGAELAVRHLVEHGHRRIGFVQLEEPAHWAFDRRRGYLRAMAGADITLDKRLTLWLDPQAPGDWTAQLEQYLKAGQPSALLFGTSAAVEALGPLVRKGLRIPQDLSLVVIGQDDAVPGWLGGVRPTVVELPLREIGRRAGRMARQLVETGEIPMVTTIPCTLDPGHSVASA